MEFTRGDLLQVDVEAIVNAVNCVGVMGRGIAAQFKTAYPENFKAYSAACKRKEVVPGRMFIFETGQLTNPRFIVNFPTKRHWRDKSRIEDIEAGLIELIEEVKKRGIKSIAIPPLGCGLGGLDWKVVRPLIERAFAAVPAVRALVFEPNGEGPPEKMAKTPETPRLTPGCARGKP
jgi:O-acetyl-ADP-ribose deacetylase (regulator of RNase III)